MSQNLKKIIFNICSKHQKLENEIRHYSSTWIDNQPVNASTGPSSQLLFVNQGRFNEKAFPLSFSRLCYPLITQQIRLISSICLKRNDTSNHFGECSFHFSFKNDFARIIAISSFIIYLSMSPFNQ